MSTEHVNDGKGKARPKPSQEAAGPQMDHGHTEATPPLTKAEMEGKLDPGKLKRMQQTMGNAAVQRFLAQRSKLDSGFEMDDETASDIRSKKGSGQSLDPGIAKKAGAVMGQDFSDVNVHTDAKADNLSRKIQAKAFTTGNDIFFKEGAYSPKSDEGQKLIAHELTHVVHQGGSAPAVQGKMRVNDPNDAHEAEADTVADKVMSAPDDAQRVPGAELQAEETQAKREDTAQRQDQREDEGEEIAATKRDDAVQRVIQLEQGKKMEEEEEAIPPVATKRDDAIQRVFDIEEKRDDTAQRVDEELPEQEAATKRDDAVQRVVSPTDAVPEEEAETKRDDAVQRVDEELPEQEAATKRDDAVQLQMEEEESPINEKRDDAVQMAAEADTEEEMAEPKRDDTVQKQEEPMDEPVG